MILNIETSTTNCSVCIANNGNNICLIEENINNYNHTEKLHIFIKYALEGAGIKINELNAVCINIGPGSYTGIRIASSTAKGICFILKIPLILIDTSNIMLETISLKEDKNLIIITMINLNQEKKYIKIFDYNKKMIEVNTKMSLDKYSFQKYSNKNIYIIGDNLKNYINILKIKYKYLSYKISAYDMKKLSNKYYKNKIFKNINNFNIIY